MTDGRRGAVPRAECRRRESNRAREASSGEIAGASPPGPSAAGEMGGDNPATRGRLGGALGGVDEPRPSPRAQALADLYRNAAALAEAGDLAGARALNATIATMLGGVAATDGTKVRDLAEERVRRARRPGGS